MSRTRSIVSALAVVAALLPVVARSAPAGASTHTVVDHALTFDHANIVDPFRLISEPNLAIDSTGAVYTSGPGGSASQQSSFWKSDDNGIQYHPVGIAGDLKQNSVLGGGDTEYALASDDTLYAADQEFLLCNATFRSDDRAKTFTTGETCLPGTDRPWMAVYDPTGTPQGRRVYFAANQGALVAGVGCYLNVSTDDGRTYLPANGGTGVFGSNEHCVGHMAIDQTNGTLYIPTSRGVWKSTDGGKTFTNLGNPPGPIATTLFANLATDSAGNLYFFYTRTRSGSDGPVMLAMIPKGSTTWSTPVQVNTPDLKANVFPWIVAGDTGRIAMMYVSTTDTGFNSSGPGIGGTNAQWNVYVAMSTDAIGCNPTCIANPSPTFTQVQADDHVMHKGTICIGGFPGCLQGQADRSMADFFVINMDPRDGRVFLVWDDNADRDTANNIGKSYVTIARQRTGPSLLASHDDLLPSNLANDVAIGSATVEGSNVTVTGTHGLPPGNFSKDPIGDAAYPVTPVVGPNAAALDLTEAAVRESGDSYEFSIEASDLSAQAIAAAAAETGGTPSWMLTWWDRGPTAATDQHYYVKWRGNGDAEYGKVGDVLYPALGAPAPKFLTYAPSGTTAAHVVGNTVTITVPKASVGAPATGDKIDNVTAYGLSEKGAAIPSVVDATKAFSYVVGTPAAAQHAPDGYIQVSIDDPTFANPVDATITGNAWTAAVPSTGTIGMHTIYARQVLSSSLYPSTWPDVIGGPVATSSVMFGGP